MSKCTTPTWTTGGSSRRRTPIRTRATAWSRFFHRQDSLKSLRIEKDLAAALKGVDAVVLAVRHAPYLKLDPDEVFANVGKPFAIIDCFCMLTDEQIRRYFELGCEVKGMGRGHIRRLKDELRQEKAERVASRLPEPVAVKAKGQRLGI